ncbi:MAG: TOBE domain-containing protein, partial [Candidatus Altiarchaeota archaeon]|nr:TOBE domain-containing protein [Candidatus Altiarchaeota archaeon]
DRIILMNRGRVVQVDSRMDSYARPKTLFGAYFIGESNFLSAKKMGPRIASYGDVLFNLEADVPADEVILTVRPEKILFERHERNTLRCRVENVHFLGRSMRYELSYGGRPVYVETSKASGIGVSDVVDVYFPPGDIMVFRKDAVDEEVTVI